MALIIVRSGADRYSLFIFKFVAFTFPRRGDIKQLSEWWGTLYRRTTAHAKSYQALRAPLTFRRETRKSKTIDTLTQLDVYDIHFILPQPYWQRQSEVGQNVHLISLMTSGQTTRRTTAPVSGQNSDKRFLLKSLPDKHSGNDWRRMFNQNMSGIAILCKLTRSVSRH